jgi:Protein of unknown function (DUF2778)
VRGNSSRAEHCRKLAVKYHELGKSAQPSYLGDFYRGVAVRSFFMAQEASERAKREIELNAGQADLPPSITAVCRSDNSGGILDFPAVENMGSAEGAGPPATRGKDTRSLRQIGLRYAVTGALAFGFTLGLVVTYGLAYGRLRAVPSRPSVSKTTASMSFDFQRPEGSQMPSSSEMRLASLEMPVFGFETDDIDPSALARLPSAFGDRLLPVERSDSFDQRFKGLAVRSVTAPAMIGEREGSAGTARQPTRERPTVQSAIGRSSPKPAPASTLVSAEKKRVRTADLSQDSLPFSDSHTAVYDIAAHMVYMPNGRRLEAHSGLGNLMDDPSHINAKGRGPTPPNVYDLTLREQLFHGVRALRLNPVDESKRHCPAEC